MLSRLTRGFVTAKQRPLRDVPMFVRLILPLALLLQLGLHGMSSSSPVARIRALPEPLADSAYRLVALGDAAAAARYLDIWLQSFDYQPGISLSFHQLDYHRLTRWLDTLLQLDPQSQYPMLLASRIYGSIHDPQKQRIMLDFVHARFQQQPQCYWRWLAEAVVTAKHELHDPSLALSYADALYNLPASMAIPYWAREMKIFVLEDMGEYEAARALVGALLASGEIRDPQEIRFLQTKLQELAKKR